MAAKTILVTGADGLVGQALRRLSATSPHKFFFIGRKDADLTKEDDVVKMFSTHRPNYVIHTAAKVGGIGGNMIGQADYFYHNILMNTYVIHYCHKFDVEKLLAFSSVCVFPDDVNFLQEDLMHDGPPFIGNFAYAYAKRMVDVQIRAYKSQFNRIDYCSVIPGNIYGTHDFYNLQYGHVIPSLIYKVWTAKKKGEDFTIWGDGNALREFILSDDVAQILVQLLELQSLPERLLVAGYEQHSIRNVVELLAQVSGFKGRIVFDTSKPIGQKSRRSDLTLLKSLFPDFKPMPLKQGLAIAYDWFDHNYPNVRLDTGWGGERKN